MHKIMKEIGYILILLIILPYIITICIQGESVSVSNRGNVPYVTVKLEDATKQIPLDEYGIGILAKEIDPTYELETMKAQAVLIRTSIYKEIQEKGSNTILETSYWTRNQMETNWGVREFGEIYKKINEAWQTTDGEVLMYEGKLILTPYHRLSNGKTRSGKEVFGNEEYPYLKKKKCPADIEAKGATTITMIQGTSMKVKERDSAKYVLSVACGKEIVTGEAFRKTHHIVSSCYSLEEGETQTKIIAKGIGHGLGMSQYTANEMAKDGKKYEEILDYFFENVSRKEVAEILVKPE